MCQPSCAPIAEFLATCSCECGNHVCVRQEARRFGKPYNLRIAAALGGMNKHEQFRDLKGGSEAAVATPGRLIDLLKMGACALRRCTYLVFDEADRMFDLGFEPQVA